jgi:hypothetical protein
MRRDKERKGLKASLDQCRKKGKREEDARQELAVQVLALLTNAY